MLNGSDTSEIYIVLCVLLTCQTRKSINTSRCFLAFFHCGPSTARHSGAVLRYWTVCSPLLSLVKCKGLLACARQPQYARPTGSEQA